MIKGLPILKGIQANRSNIFCIALWAVLIATLTLFFFLFLYQCNKELSSVIQEALLVYVLSI